MKIDYVLLSVCVNDSCLNDTNEIAKVPINAQSDNTLTVVSEIATIFCRKCKKNCVPESFVNAVSNSPHATCLDCRTRDHARRFPTVFEPMPSQGPSDFIGKINNY